MVSIYTNEEVSAIYESHCNTVYRISYIMLHNTVDAEDNVQTVFEKLLRQTKKFNNASHLKAWLIVTAKNAAKDTLKSFWKTKTRGLSDEEPVTDSPVYSDIGMRVMNLDKKYRIPIYLYYYEGYKTEEIARMLHLSSSTVRSQLRTARQKLAIEEEL